jgi:hypothetical protein
METEGSLPSSQGAATESYPKNPSHSKTLVTFPSRLGIYGERLLALHPTPKLNAYPYISWTQLLVQYTNSNPLPLKFLIVVCSTVPKINYHRAQFIKSDYHFT